MKNKDPSQKISDYAKQICLVCEQLDKGLDLQDSSSKMMLSLAGDLLDFSQLKNGRFRKTYTKFDVQKCIQEVIDMQ